MQKLIKCLVVFTIGGFALLGCNKNEAAPKYTEIKIKHENIHAEIAATDQEKVRGLQFVKHLGANDGMLFIYQPPQVITHWMKDMIIPLDMIWIDQDKKIIKISTDVPVCVPNTTCATYSSDIPAVYVLEVNAGYSTAHGIKPGMKVEFDENQIK